MKKLYTTIAVLLLILSNTELMAQLCSNLIISGVVAGESRCMATGTITVTVSGGTGNYNYRVEGPLNTPYTSSSVISGLSAGTYKVMVRDVTSGCMVEMAAVTVPGTYTDPRFTIVKTDETCQQASDGSISLGTLNGGRAPYTYTIVAPSPFGVGNSNNTGIFMGLPGGEYAIELKDSCGGIQTRRVSILGYNWRIESHTGSRTSCNEAGFDIRLRDSRGNSNTSSPLFAGFQYGVVNTPGDTSWYNNYSFTHNIGTNRVIPLVVKDNCGNVRNTTWTDQHIPSVANVVATSFQSCNSFTAEITGQVNLLNPEYCLYESNGNQVSCNTGGSFTGITAGDYYITVRDACFDTTIFRNFTINPPVLSLDSEVAIDRVDCYSFNATASGLVNFTNPGFCLYDSLGNELACNMTGSFTGLTYGRYCIKVKDGCYDTTIERCFLVMPLIPVVEEELSVQRSCNTIDISAGGRNLTNPEYCLYDTNDVLIGCNSTGIFPNLPYGSYCMTIRNDASCYDTTIRRCITVAPEIPSIGSLEVSNQVCTGFDLRVQAQTGLTNPEFRLKNGSGDIIAVNGTGEFSNIPYGNYCVEMQNDVNCYDTLITRCVSPVRPVPAAGGVDVSGNNCSGFSASLSWINNFTNPEFTLLDSLNNVVATNTTGHFSGIAYGSYCISVKDQCYDTTIIRCFTGTPVALTMNLSASASCELNATNIRVWVSGGSGPFTLNVYDPSGTLAGTRTGSSMPLRMYNLAALAPGEQYRVVVEDQCGNTAASLISPVLSTFTSALNVTAKCPSGTFQDGSSELTITVNSNLGTVRPVIISKNGSSVYLPYNTGTTAIFRWTDLGPASYVVQYNLPGSCNNKVFDTVVVGPYQYPRLNKSAPYQCDNNSFTVSANVSGGAPPFMYEIIGSIPTSPSIIAPPQASPVFNINNGNKYSLVRLRVVDYCGNATLNDISVLPLQNTVITASSDCYYSSVVLSVDSFANADYTWYYKTGATDSILVGTDRIFEIPYLMPADLGTYVSKVSINSGCLVRVNYHEVTGKCKGGLLPGKIELAGKLSGELNILNWNRLLEGNIKMYVIEKAEGSTVNFSPVGQVTAQSNMQVATFSFSDPNAGKGKTRYRIKAVDQSGNYLVSNTIILSRESNTTIHVYPNPVKTTVNISLQTGRNGEYLLELYTAGGQLVYSAREIVNGTGVVIIRRQNNMKPGLYLLKLSNKTNGETVLEKLIFE